MSVSPDVHSMISSWLTCDGSLKDLRPVRSYWNAVAVTAADDELSWLRHDTPSSTKECTWLVTLDHAVLLVCRVAPAIKQMLLFNLKASPLSPFIYLFFFKHLFRPEKISVPSSTIISKRNCFPSQLNFPKNNKKKITPEKKIPLSTEQNFIVILVPVVPFPNCTSRRECSQRLTRAKFTVLQQSPKPWTNLHPLSYSARSPHRRRVRLKHSSPFMCADNVRGTAA